MKNIFVVRRFFFTLVLTGFLNGCATEASTSDAKERLATARAMFAKRCETAGEKIYRKADDVEGIFILKLRPNDLNSGDQFALDDPYGSDYSGNGYIETFIRGSYQATVTGGKKDELRPRLGYLYADAVDPKNGLRYRYTGRIEEPWQKDKSYLKGYHRFVLDKILVSDNLPRYGVTYDDISTRQEREYWIAGSSLKVIDLKTNEIIAERIGYMMDKRQGSLEGFRSPWLFAAENACPGFSNGTSTPSGRPAYDAQARQTQDFVEKVLHPAINRKK
ncbi:MAG: hypothetical protein V4605_08575 [Pseudomonadota bacterium]